MVAVLPAINVYGGGPAYVVKNGLCFSSTYVANQLETTYFSTSQPKLH